MFSRRCYHLSSESIVVIVIIEIYDVLLLCYCGVKIDIIYNNLGKNQIFYPDPSQPILNHQNLLWPILILSPTQTSICIARYRTIWISEDWGLPAKTALSHDIARFLAFIVRYRTISCDSSCDIEWYRTISHDIVRLIVRYRVISHDIVRLIVRYRTILPKHGQYRAIFWFYQSFSTHMTPIWSKNFVGVFPIANGSFLKHNWPSLSLIGVIWVEKLS